MLRRTWIGPPAVPADGVARLVEALDVSPAVGRILFARGHDCPDSARRFLYPEISRLSPPDAFLGADAAIEVLLDCVRRRRRILVFGDFDVDGVTGTSLAVRALADLGADVDFLLPQRLVHGYGLSAKVLSDVRARRPDVVLTVDCGIKSVEEVAELRRMGIETIVTDHHEPGRALPPAAAVVDPKQAGCPYPDKDLAGVGVVWQLLRGVVERVEHEFDLRRELDLVALGTVADVVPLVGENRALVTEGLAAVERRARVGMMALVEVAGIEERADAWHLAYLLGPRVNAAGRLGDAGEAVRLFLSRDSTEARRLARSLDEENVRRQEISESTVRQALEAIERGTAGAEPTAIVLASNQWHPGVIGIASARLVERFHRPSALIAMDGDVGRGSVRSIRGIDVCAVLQECEDLLVQFGGHAMAAGLTIRRDDVAEFRARFAAGVAARLTDEIATPRLRIDGEIEPKDVDLGLAEGLAGLGPFGFGNPRPVFVLRGVTPAARPKVVGRGHLKLSVRRPGDADLDCIGFELGRREAEFPGGRVDLVGSVAINEWNGRRSAQLQVADFREAAA
jgi:single-stranded-DNA-specific exonuclease